MTIKIECMPRDLKGVHICNHLLDILDAWIAELQDLLAIQANQMVVLSEEKRRFIFGL